MGAPGAPDDGGDTLPSRIQHGLSRYYGLDSAPVGDFIEPADEEDSREALLIRQLGDDIAVALRLPRTVLAEGWRPSFDELCQVAEGVSHFLYVAERARRELPATQLELELQAEVDKYLLLAHGLLAAAQPGRPFEPERSARIRARLFDRVSYLHPAGTEAGDRYRMANDLAARFAGKLEASFARHGRFEQMRAALRRFYCAGQTEKIELARAA
jgi:hypothetical protein